MLHIVENVNTSTLTVPLSNTITNVNGLVTSSSIANHVPKHILYLVTIQAGNCHNHQGLIVYHIWLVDVSVSNMQVEKDQSNT